MKAHNALYVVACALMGLLTSRVALAQDAAVANSTTVAVKLDNPNVRVLESTLKPGQKENLHSHPPSVIYVIAGGKVRNHSADGKAVDSELVTGAVLYRDPLTHWAENIGATPIHLIITELKDRE